MPSCNGRDKGSDFALPEREQTSGMVVYHRKGLELYELWKGQLPLQRGGSHKRENRTTHRAVGFYPMETHRSTRI